MGLNMPAKTVVFTSVRKFDGKDFRWVRPGEYIQMSGRAGRRGKDDRGIVILMVDEKMEPHVAKNMVKGAPDALMSSFHLGYNMLLNLLRVEGVDPEMLIKRSFHQFQSDKALPGLEQRLAELRQRHGEMKIANEEAVRDYYDIRVQLAKQQESMRETLNMPAHALQYLQSGRLARVKNGAEDWGWGVIVNFQKKKNVNKSVAGDASDYVVDMLLSCSADSTAKKPKPAEAGEKGQMLVVPVLLSLFDGMSTLLINIPKDLRTPDNRQSVAVSLREVRRPWR